MTLGEYIKYILLLIFLPRSIRTMEWKMLRLVNKDRKANGLPPVRMQDDLRRVARKHSRDMARQGYFEHENLKGLSHSDRLELARVTDIVSGENLAKLHGYKNVVQEAEIGLMNSPGHRANILKPDFNTVGIGVVRSVHQTYYFTQNFAHRNLIFTKKIPKRVTTKRGLRLRGEAFTNIKRIIYQIKRTPESKEIIYENLVNLKDKKFDFIIPFKEVGIFYVLIYTEMPNKEEVFKAANVFEVKVRKGWF